MHLIARRGDASGLATVHHGPQPQVVGGPVTGAEKVMWRPSGDQSVGIRLSDGISAPGRTSRSSPPPAVLFSKNSMMPFRLLRNISRVPSGDQKAGIGHETAGGDPRLLRARSVSQTSTTLVLGSTSDTARRCSSGDRRKSMCRRSGPVVSTGFPLRSTQVSRPLCRIMSAQWCWSEMPTPPHVRRIPANMVGNQKRFPRVRADRHQTSAPATCHDPRTTVIRAGRRPH